MTPEESASDSFEGRVPSIDGMTPEQVKEWLRTIDQEWIPGQFVSHAELSQAELRLRSKRNRLTWAVAFAQEPIEQLSPGRVYDLRLELTAFLTWARGRIVRHIDRFALVTEEELHATQAEFARILAGLLQGEMIRLGEYPVIMQLNGHKRSGELLLYEGLNLDTVPVPRQACYGLARVLGEVDFDLMVAGYEGPLVKACPAPKVRGRGEEQCGRWFVGRPNQRYCSSQCQTRAATRATRARASTKTPDRKWGTRKQSRQGKG